ncbi:MAG TPA: zinc ABC transporter permease, partial [Alphaproteobacteria bacterium]|nr:zinc ABC transporter permease [Alphaproteobacteria bacterium]
ALGVMAASSGGSGIDLVHLLFGSILAVDPAGLILAATLASLTLVCMAIIYRPLLVESFDPVFMRAAGGHGALIHSILLALVVVNLVAGFQVMGTLMSVGLMMLPAAAARLWCANVWPMMITAACAAALCSFAGLIISFHGDWPSGPAIVLVCSGFYFVSLMVGTQQGLLWRVIQGRHIHDPHNPVVTPSRQPKQ